jgi:hypothetical protein
MKYILILLLVITASYADKIKRKTFACPSIELIKKAPTDKKSSIMDLNMYAIANDCVVLSKHDRVEAVDYNANNSKDLFIKILYKKTGALLYIRSSAIIVEKHGKKSNWRF